MRTPANPLDSLVFPPEIDAHMRAIAADPQTRRWWQETDPCQIQLPTRQPGANWSDMEMVFLME